MVTGIYGSGIYFRFDDPVNNRNTENNLGQSGVVRGRTVPILHRVRRYHAVTGYCHSRS